MNIAIDDALAAKLQELARDTGKSMSEVLEEAVTSQLELKYSFVSSSDDVEVWKPKLLALVEQMAAMPNEGPEDGFSGADHDEVLYPRHGDFC